MSEQIGVGDLVQIVHDCCNQEPLGFVGKVREISAGLFICEECGYKYTRPQARIDGLAKVDEVGTESLGWIPLPWLKRIPPLGELESEKQKEDLREPA